MDIWSMDVSDVTMDDERYLSTACLNIKCTFMDTMEVNI